MLPRILVAGTADAIEVVRDALRGDAELLVARSVREAVAHIEPALDAVVCNLRFDDSRMFEFLQVLREHPAGRGAQVICIRVGAQALSEATRRSIKSALEALEVEVFVDLEQLSKRYGKEIARETLRQLVLGKAAPGAEFLLSSAASRPRSG